MSGWVKVEDGLPEHDPESDYDTSRQVWVYGIENKWDEEPETMLETGYYDHDDGEWHIPNMCFEAPIVTHWHPAPEPPKEDEL